MTGPIAALTVLLALAVVDGAGAQVPNVDLERTCRAPSIGGDLPQERDYKQCIDSESKARERLQDEWHSFSAAHRRQCVQPSVYLPSYVEWLTCLEMERLAQQLRGASAPPTSLITGGSAASDFELSSLGNTTRRAPLNVLPLPRPRPVITTLPAEENATAERPPTTGTLPRPVAPTRTRPPARSARQP
jgi:hypothetical protein